MTKKGRGERVKLQEQRQQAIDYGNKNRWREKEREARNRELNSTKDFI